MIITDDKSCTAHDTFVLTQPAKLASTVTSIPTSCYDSSDGSALVSVSGGVLPYKYLWNNSDTNAVNTDVAAGSYSVIITDGNGCLHYDTVGVTQPPIIQVSKIITPVSCNMGSDGKIDLTVSRRYAELQLYLEHNRHYRGCKRPGCGHLFCNCEG